MSDATRPGPAHEISAVAVVVPVHDEEDLLPRCLHALGVAVAELREADPHVRVEVVLALDACSDASERVAASHGVPVVRLDSRCVGSARAAGVSAAGALLGVGARHRPEHTWVAGTDADTIVPREWLVEQIHGARRGAGLVLGRVRPDPLELDEEIHRRWRERHTSSATTAHVHGANLGVRWSELAAVGGFPGVVVHEDVLLVDALLARGVPVARGLEVVTSARRHGRAPGGFAAYLRHLESAAPVPRQV